MRWESSENVRAGSSRKKQSRQLPLPGRIMLGAVAIAAIILAFISNPPPQGLSLPKAAPDVPRPTTVAAAIVPIPTSAPTVASALPTPPPATPSPSTGRVHEVVQGDTLSTIAKKYYNDPTKWNKIMDANKDTLKSPDSLQLGQKLKIPD